MKNIKIIFAQETGENIELELPRILRDFLPYIKVSKTPKIIYR
jgi:hypothetical protein